MRIWFSEPVTLTPGPSVKPSVGEGPTPKPSTWKYSANSPEPRSWVVKAIGQSANGDLGSTLMPPFAESCSVSLRMSAVSSLIVPDASREALMVAEV